MDANGNKKEIQKIRPAAQKLIKMFNYRLEVFKIIGAIKDKRKDNG